MLRPYAAADGLLDAASPPCMRLQIAHQCAACGVCHGIAETVAKVSPCNDVHCATSGCMSWHICGPSDRFDLHLAGDACCHACSNRLMLANLQLDCPAVPLPAEQDTVQAAALQHTSLVISPSALAPAGVCRLAPAIRHMRVLLMESIFLW